jgi:NAD(P)-dependent dehydrogenase (short-subunit alcohol dehydrogenase family)
VSATAHGESELWPSRNKEAIMIEVIVLIGAGSIGQAIARRVSAGKKVVVADLQQGNADAAADVLSNAGFEVRPTTVDVSSREAVQTLVETATTLGDVTGVIHRRVVVRCIATAGEPADQKEHRESEPGESEQSLPRPWHTSARRVGRLFREGSGCAVTVRSAKGSVNHAGIPRSRSRCQGMPPR